MRQKKKLITKFFLKERASEQEYQLDAVTPPDNRYLSSTNPLKSQALWIEIFLKMSHRLSYYLKQSSGTHFNHPLVNQKNPYKISMTLLQKRFGVIRVEVWLKNLALLVLSLNFYKYYTFPFHLYVPTTVNFSFPFNLLLNLLCARNPGY